MPNSGNYVEFLIPVVVTVSEILPTRTVIPGIINSGSGNCFSGAWCVQGSPSAGALGAQNRTSLPLRQGRALPLSPGADSKVVRAVLVPVVPIGLGDVLQFSTFPTLSLIPGMNNSGGGNDFRNLHFCFNSGNSLLRGMTTRSCGRYPFRVPRLEPSRPGQV